MANRIPSSSMIVLNPMAARKDVHFILVIYEVHMNIVRPKQPTPRIGDEVYILATTDRLNMHIVRCYITFRFFGHYRAIAYIPSTVEFKFVKDDIGLCVFHSQEAAQKMFELMSIH